LGLALGVTFSLCFVTGLASHLIQDPVSWLPWPATPRDLYRWTTATHVVSGVVSVPLLLAKLWAVSPKLWTWPPFSSVPHAVERLALVPLVGGSLLLLTGGLDDVFYWYPNPRNFRPTHYWLAWITVGALVVHIGAKVATTRVALRPETGVDAVAQRSRRGFLHTVGWTAGAVGLSFLGANVSPLRALAILPSRRSDVEVQGLPVQTKAEHASVVEQVRDPGFRLRVVGAVATELELSLDDLRQRATHAAGLPIACVQGWSVGAHWRGVPVRALLAEAGVEGFREVVVTSIQERAKPDRMFGSALLNRDHALHPDTLLAVELNGEPLHIDHGFPTRLIAPNNPGIMQTKWVERLEVR
jgi:DMSO/TMAO reductase YedYZ molybdopterin-dependent catalytic subunit